MVNELATHEMIKSDVVLVEDVKSRSWPRLGRHAHPGNGAGFSHDLPIPQPTLSVLLALSTTSPIGSHLLPNANLQQKPSRRASLSVKLQQI